LSQGLGSSLLHLSHDLVCGRGAATDELARASVVQGLRDLIRDRFLNNPDQLTRDGVGPAVAAIVRHIWLRERQNPRPVWAHCLGEAVVECGVDPRDFLTDVVLDCLEHGVKELGVRAFFLGGLEAPPDGVQNRSHALLGHALHLGPERIHEAVLEACVGHVTNALLPMLADVDHHALVVSILDPDSEEPTHPRTRHLSTDGGECQSRDVTDVHIHLRDVHAIVTCAWDLRHRVWVVRGHDLLAEQRQSDVLVHLLELFEPSLDRQIRCGATEEPIVSLDLLFDLIDGREVPDGDGGRIVACDTSTGVTVDLE